MYERCFDQCLAQEEAEIRKEFQRFDLDKNGYITKGRNYNLLWRGDIVIVLQNVPSEANPKVRNHEEGPY